MNHQIINNGDRVTSNNGDRYRIIQFLGAGGNCQVYLAMSTEGEYHGVLFAIKFFLKNDDHDRLKQYKKETDFLIRTTHPAIMKMYSEGEYFYTTDSVNIPFVIMDYFPDRLDYRLRNSKLGMSEKLIYVMQLLSALRYLESIEPKIVHRDIKPQNIFLKGNSCVLGDFGLMRDLVEDITDDDGNFFKQSGGPGMPRFYRTPDLVRYAKKESSLTTRSDIFQLGLVTAEMFTGRNPLKKSTDRLENVVLEDLNDIRGQHGKLIKNLIEKMLVDDPNYRSSIEDLLDSFDGVLREITSKMIEINGFAF